MLIHLSEVLTHEGREKTGTSLLKSRFSTVQREVIRWFHRSRFILSSKISESGRFP